MKTQSHKLAYALGLTAACIATIVGMNSTYKQERKMNMYPSKQHVTAQLREMYDWFNFIADSSKPFDPIDVQKFFASDFEMVLNGEVKTSNYETLARHFENFRKSDFIVSGAHIFEDVVYDAESGKVAVKYELEKIFKNASRQRIQVIAIFTLNRAGKFSRMNEVVFVSDALGCADKL